VPHGDEAMVRAFPRYQNVAEGALELVPYARFRAVHRDGCVS